MINYYHILGISQKATQKEIKEAYRKLARQYHPDRNPDSTYAEERFKEISQAYRVLRNPASKARHDHSLAFDALKQAGHSPAFEYSSPPPYAYEQQRNYRRYRPGKSFRPFPPVTSRQNIIGTAWAFGILFMLTLVVVGFSSYHSYQQEQQRAKDSELAMGIYKKAENFYQQEKYEYSLQLLKTIDDQHSTLYDAGRLKQAIFEKLMQKADENFEQKNYKEAAFYYQLLANHKQKYDALTYAKLVSSYEMIPDYPQAIATYKKVIKEEPSTIEARVRLAALLYQIEEYNKALGYYLQASRLVSKDYEETYGKGYPLAVNPKKTPESHYQLHLGLGITYLKLGMYQQALSSLKWAIFLRPEEAEAHYLMGNVFWQEGQASEACKKWKEAKKYGSPPAAQQLTTHCK